MKLLILLLGTLLVIALMAHSAATAAASPAHRDAVLAATDAFISETLHVPISQRSDRPGAPGQLASGQGAVRCLVPETANYDPPVLDAMVSRSAPSFLAAWAVVLHEHLHLRGGPCIYDSTGELDPTWIYFEEGFGEAVRADLFPAFMWRMFHLRVWFAADTFYPERVRTVRALSKAATGSWSWHDRAAVLWRRQALLADWDTRQAMIAAARAAA